MVRYIPELNSLKQKLSIKTAEKQFLEQQLEDTIQLLKDENETLLNTEKARIIVQTVANDLQKNLEYQISNIVTLALTAVFPDPYEFKVQFVTRRNQTECDFYFVKDGNECDPVDSSGGGPLDIASLALRVAIWSIKKNRAVMVLDEPAKFLSRDLQEKASEMIKMLSKELGIQVIMVSHLPGMIEAADKIISVENINGISKVKEQ